MRYGGTQAGLLFGLAVAGAVLLGASRNVCADVSRDGPEFQINTIEIEIQALPAVDDVPHGGFVVVWEGDEGLDLEAGYVGVHAQRLDTRGDRIGTEFLVSPPTFERPDVGNGAGKVAVHGDGSFVVVWDNARLDGSYDGVFARRFDANADALGSHFQINTYTTYQQYRSVVAATDGGEFVVAWLDAGYFGATGTNIFGQRFASDGARVGAEFQIPESTAGIPIIPMLAGLGSGEFVATWTALNADGDDDVFAQRFDASGKIGPEILVNTYTTHNQRHADVVGSANKSFLVAWHSVGQDGDGNGIYAQRFGPTGEKDGSEFQVNQYTTGDQDRPKPALAPDGSFLVVWTSIGQDGDDRGVFARRYLTDGTDDGDEFQVNTYTTGAQGGSRFGHAVDVAVDDLGRILVVWQSRYGDSVLDGIVGQILCVDPPASVAVCGNSTCAGQGTPEAPEIAIGDALAVLKGAVGLRPCAPCRCDVNGSGSVTTTDALAVLGIATGQQIALGCPACE